MHVLGQGCEEIYAAAREELAQAMLQHSQSKTAAKQAVLERTRVEEEVTLALEKWGHQESEAIDIQEEGAYRDLLEYINEGMNMREVERQEAAEQLRKQHGASKHAAAEAEDRRKEHARWAYRWMMISTMMSFTLKKAKERRGSRRPGTSPGGRAGEEDAEYAAPGPNQTR